MSVIVELDAVSFVRGGRRIIDNVSWRVDRGRHWILLGANGSGKTTLLQLITGYLWRNGGRARVLGHTLGETDLRALRRRIGWVSSAIEHRFPARAPARDVVVSGKFASIGLYYDPIEEADTRRAGEVLASGGCASLAERAWGVLSQGERQRVMIARALMASPALLILDEPCAGLDLAARERFLEMLERLARRPEAPTLLMVTHHVEEITPAFENALLLKEGRVVAAGPANETLTSERLSDTMGIDLIVERDGGRFRARVRH